MPEGDSPVEGTVDDSLSFFADAYRPHAKIMNKTIICWALVAVGLLALGVYILKPKKEARPPGQAVPQSPPAASPRTGPKIFYFSPPEGFNDENLFWGNHHYLARAGAQGVEKEGLVRVEGPAMNFSQSAYDPSTDTLYTWKKNYKPSVHYIMRLAGADVRCQPLAGIPGSGFWTPLLAVDSRRHRIFVAGKEDFLGIAAPPEFHIYDVGAGQWQSGRFADIRFITLDYPFWYSTDCVLGTQAEGYEFCHIN